MVSAEGQMLVWLRMPKEPRGYNKVGDPRGDQTRKQGPNHRSLRGTAWSLGLFRYNRKTNLYL
jgi:hypothetical protein